ncbi:uncharacterized protein il2 [Siphateles boraxobius]|uniref:uncharacterized protein il2 n=1 Tax=Siphateles boraxobius TaxID=180520 RepID=UPI004063C55F
MSALHWICALTLAMVCCLSAQPVKRQANEKTLPKLEIFDLLQMFTKFTTENCPDDTKIYSPTDIDQDCLSSALNCTIKELMVLKNECRINQDNGNGFVLYSQLFSGLKNVEQNTSPSSSSCNSCETSPEKDVQQFLKDIQILVERW